MPFIDGIKLAWPIIANAMDGTNGQRSEDRSSMLIQFKESKSSEICSKFAAWR